MNLAPDHVLIPVHGILSGSHFWGEALRQRAIERRMNVAVHPCYWGPMGAVQMYLSRVWTWRDDRRDDKFAKLVLHDILPLYRRGTPYTLIGHSQGTDRILGALRRHQALAPEGVVLIGSVLDNRFYQSDWYLWLSESRIERLLNLWSPHDLTIRLFNWPGKLGATGFVDLPNSARAHPGSVTSQAAHNWPTQETHSSYFDRGTRDTYFDKLLRFSVEGQLPVEARP